jgi:cytochrome P450
VIDMEDFFGRLIDERRTSPHDDLITSMVRAQDDGDQLSRDELISACVTLLLAGHETTKNLISNGVLTLLRRPEVAQSIRDEPALVDSAVEEILRYESPIQRGWRRVARDTVVRGQTVRAGQLVYYMFGAANRDPDVFSDPSAFRVDRTPNRHLGFGYGIHFCLGAALARMEGSVLFATLLARYPEASLVTDAITWQQNVHVRCPTMLRVSLGARAT